MENGFDHGFSHFAHRPAWSVFRIIGLVVAGVVAAVVFALLFGWLVFLLWNWLMPALFGLKAVTYWQAFGIVLLSKMLFSGFGLHHGRRHDLYGGKRRWHRHGPFSGKDDGDYRIRGSNRNWGYYDQFWKDEGKAAFEAYISRLQQKQGD